MRGNTVTIEVSLQRGKMAKTVPLYQYDYGQKLIFTNVELPSVYEVHFSNELHGESVTMIGDSTGVLIPDSLLATGLPVYLWAFLHTDTDDGETEYTGVVPVIQRAKPSDAEPTPEEQSAITQAIAALNTGVATVESAVSNIDNTIQTSLQEAKESGIFDGADGTNGRDGTDGFTPTIGVTAITGGYQMAITNKSGTSLVNVMNGVNGARGQAGADGYTPVKDVDYFDGEDGEDGFSPTATISKDGTVATISITDKNGTTTATISDGEKGDTGDTGTTPSFSIGTVETGDPDSDAEVTISGTQEEPVLNFSIPKGDPGDATIDDTAGAGDTDKVWSADKLQTEFDDLKHGKADVIEIVDDTPEAVKTIRDGADGEPMALTVGIEPVQSGSGDPSPTNVRPISGWTGTTITKIGKNLIPDGTNTANGYELDKYLKIDGTTAAAVNNYISEYFPVEANGTYTMHSKTKTMNNACVCFYDENKNYIAGSAVNYQKMIKTITAPATAVWARATQGYNTGEFAQFEKGSVPTEIVPYSSNEYQINFPDEAGTVYGATLTVNKDGTGILAVNRYLLDLSSVGTYYPDANGDYINARFGRGSSEYALDTPVDKMISNVLSSVAGTVTFGNREVYSIAIRKQNYYPIEIKLPGAYDTSAKIKAFFADIDGNGTHGYVALNKAETQYELTVQQVNSILGINNIFADTGDILSVDYSADTKLHVDAVGEDKQEQIDSIHSMIAESDAVTATESHAIGDVFICNNKLLRATDAIATWETVVVGSNAEVINLADYIKEQVTDIAVLRTDVDALKALPIPMNDILLKKLGFSDFVSESSNYGRVELHGNVLTAKATPSGSTYYHINLLGTHRVKSGTWGNYNPLPEDFMPIDDYFKSTYMTDKNRKFCLRTTGEVKSGSGSLRLIVMKDNGDSTYTYKYAVLTITYANIALLDEAPLDISKWDGISLVFTTQSRPADMKVIFSVEEGDGGDYTLSNK